jgi:hypothetical protein
MSSRMSVVLPAPFGPMTPTISPGAAWSDTRSSAVSPPNATVTSLTTSPVDPALLIPLQATTNPPDMVRSISHTNSPLVQPGVRVD